ncbi:hypothetical protein AWB91_21175 [Mycobacterium paraense]|uniref:Uncharacterized protein n=1 Tax=Mycobacterium paraense TaxID=767916 RepID=A0ABX3VKS5_9MYCO|nr:hypothetical protein [Mycobacterium paraense]ORW29915.1 hypothetical protein AWB91_21175 [Mycobacterium paraense]ORW40039.1 hypothetical protein AWB88_15760 [Mycobacterium paraense]
MTRQGHRIFVDELRRFAAGHADPRVTAVAERCAAPLRVAVGGRRGVGRRTVARALDLAGPAHGISVTTGATGTADLDVYVTAEVVKPEDTQAIAAAARPVLAVLNKADLAGSRCAELSALVAAPMEPMSGLLAVAAADGLDGELWAALRALAADPGGATCLDGSFAGFLAADLPVPPALRLRLLDTLDLLGIALGIAAARRGATPAQVRALLRRVSGVDAVLARLSVLGAEVRYQRVLRAVAELEALAVGDEGIHRFLCCDDAVLARMAAAVDAAAAAGPDPGADPAAHLAHAVRWQRYGRGPVSALHRECGADIARGSLRLWSRAGGSLPGESD